MPEYQKRWIVKPDGTIVDVFGVAAFSDITETDKKALVDADRHPQVDVLSTANPPALDVPLSTRASEATLVSIRDAAGIKKITDPVTSLCYGFEPAVTWRALKTDAAGELQVDVVSGHVLTDAFPIKVKRGTITIAPGAHPIVLHEYGKGVLWAVSFAMSHPADLWPTVWVDGDYLSIVNTPTVSRAAVRPADLHAFGEETLWELTKYDTAAERYKVVLRRPVRFGTELQVYIYNAATVSRVVTYSVQYSLMS